MQDSDKVIMVVGRATDLSHYVETISSFLWDNFTLAVASPTDQDEEIGIDGKIRFIGFAVGSDIDELTADNQALRIRSLSQGDFSALVYPSVKEAMEAARDKYDFDNGEEAAAERAEKVRDLIDRFTRISADEAEYASIFDSLVHNERLTLMRGLLDDEPVCVLGMITTSEDQSEMKVNPMAVLLTTPKLISLVELPFNIIND